MPVLRPSDSIRRAPAIVTSSRVPMRDMTRIYTGLPPDVFSVEGHEVEVDERLGGFLDHGRAFADGHDLLAAERHHVIVLGAALQVQDEGPAGFELGGGDE